MAPGNSDTLNRDVGLERRIDGFRAADGGLRGQIVGQISKREPAHGGRAGLETERAGAGGWTVVQGELGSAMVPEVGGFDGWRRGHSEREMRSNPAVQGRALAGRVGSDASPSKSLLLPEVMGPDSPKQDGGLVSVVLVVIPRSGLFPLSRGGCDGRALHAALLALIRSKDPQCAERMHGDSHCRPFAVGLSWMGGRRVQPWGGGREPLGWVRFASFEPALSRMLRALETKDVPGLRLRERELEVVRVIRDPREHSWAGRASFVELYNNGLVRAGSGSQEQEVTLEFASPTAFQMREARLNMPLPWPRLVFQSLAEKWNSVSPIPLWIDWRAFERSVTISRHALSTVLVDFGRHRQVGFVGTCTYLVVSDTGSRDLVASVHTLADFALYAGVGKKTTMGMGSTRRCG